MSAGKQISFEPALALMFAKHLDYPAIRGEIFIVFFNCSFPFSVGYLKNSIQPVG